MPVEEMELLTKAIDPQDYVAIAKGLYDSLVPELDSRMKSLQDGFEKTLAPRLQREMEKSYEARIKDLEGRIKLLEKALDTALVVTKEIIYGASGRPEKIVEVRGRPE